MTPPVFARRRDRLLFSLTVALACSWVPFALVVVVALALGQTLMALFTAFVLVLWIVKLGEMFGVVQYGPAKLGVPARLLDRFRLHDEPMDHP